MCSSIVKEGGCLSAGELPEPVVVAPSRKLKHHATKPAKNVKSTMASGVVSSTAVPVPVTGSALSTSWNVSGTSQWRYPTDVIIHTAAQLRQLQQFLSGKVRSLLGLSFSCRTLY